MNKTAVNFIIGLSVVVIASWLGWQEVKAQGADWLPVKYVRIEGTFQYIAKDKIKNVIKEQVINGFYNADIQQIQVSVQALPWVEKVSVKRVWPDAINVSIEEQRPIVRWGKDALISYRGEVFKPNQIDKFSELPLLIGPTGYELKMLEAMESLSGTLIDKGMVLAEFRVNERRAWNIKLKNEMELNIGRNQPLKKIQRFFKTISLIGKEQIASIAVVDLRYSNGYALKWKQGEAKVDWQKVAEMNKT